MSLFGGKDWVPKDDDTSTLASEWRRKRDFGTFANTAAMFPVGSRVRIICRYQDFAFFPGDQTGMVTRKGHGEWLIVAFDEPMHYSDGSVRRDFNFQPDDLFLIEPPRYVTTPGERARGIPEGWIAR